MSVEKEYKSILRATTVFGSLQIFLIIISIIRVKFSAVILGPNGIGEVSLLNSNINLIISLTNFSIGVSAVKNISEANISCDTLKITRILIITKRLIWITGLLGMAITIIFSPFLSILTFQNYNYTISFILIAITVLLSQLNTGELVILQGMRKIELLAKANFFGSLLGLILIIPLYYIFKEKAIVPGMIIISSLLFISSKYFAKKINIEKKYVSYHRTYLEGRKILKTGFALGFTGIITMLSAYLLILFIKRVGSQVDVGLYSSGFMLVNSYTGLVFAAIATDYHPRLSELTGFFSSTKRAINQQAEISILLLTPLICGLLSYSKWVIILLYGKSFLGIDKMLHWILLGVFFKAISWAISFVFVAQGKVKIFIRNEIFASLYILLINTIFYYFFNLTGLGVSFLLSNFIYFLQMTYLSKKYFNFSFEKNTLLILLYTIIIVIFCFFVNINNSSKYSIYFGTFIFLFSFFNSVRILNKKTNLISKLNSKYLGGN